MNISLRYYTKNNRDNNIKNYRDFNLIGKIYDF